jgi:hypothetical protein
MKKRYLTPEFCGGIIAGVFLYIGFRSSAALIEELRLGFRSPIELGQAMFSSLLLVIGVGLIFRSRVCFVIAKVYAWFFVVGNSVMIPLYFTDVLPTAMKTAATIATWLTMIGMLVLIHRYHAGLVFIRVEEPNQSLQPMGPSARG